MFEKSKLKDSCKELICCADDLVAKHHLIRCNRCTYATNGVEVRKVSHGDLMRMVVEVIDDYDISDTSDIRNVIAFLNPPTYPNLDAYRASIGIPSAEDTLVRTFLQRYCHWCEDGKYTYTMSNPAMRRAYTAFLKETMPDRAPTFEKMKNLCWRLFGCTEGYKTVRLKTEGTCRVLHIPTDVQRDPVLE